MSPTPLLFARDKMQDLSWFLDFLYDGLTGFVYTPYRPKDTQEWQQKFYQWPDERESLEAWISTACEDGDVYIAPAIFSEKSARKDAVKGSQVAWVEFDGAKPDFGELPRPHLIIQSSLDDHLHCYWKANAVIPPAALESINRRLTYGLGADSSGWDANQVLRPPETINHKRDQPVQILRKQDSFFAIDPRIFDILEEPKKPVKILDFDDLPDILDVLQGNQIPDRTWKLFKEPDSAVGLRSTTLMHLGYAFAEAGLDHAEIVALLLDVDRRIEKFHGRSDQLVRLSEIASIAIGKHGGVSQVQVYSPQQLRSVEIDVDWVWGEFAHSSGSILVAGAPGIGKTQLSFGAGLHFACGRDYLGYAVPKPQRVLIVSMEMGLRQVRWLDEQQQPYFDDHERELIGNNLIYAPVGYGLKLPEIEALIKQHAPGVVIMDSLSSIAEDLIKAESVKPIMDWADKVRETYETLLWFIHHNRKATDANKNPSRLSDIYGSFLVTARPETVMSLHTKRAGAHEELELRSLKSRFSQATKMAVKRADHLIFERDDKATTSPHSGSKKQAVIKQPAPSEKIEVNKVVDPKYGHIKPIVFDFGGDTNTGD